MLRETICCSAVVIMAAANAASAESCGAEACAPLPFTRIAKILTRHRCAFFCSALLPRNIRPIMKTIELIDGEALKRPS